MARQTNQKNNVPMLKGDQFRATHQASVDAVLGAKQRRVFSKGAQFYNRDRWTARVLIKHLCAWASQNPGKTPVYDDVAAWVRKANAESVYDPYIVIASTPNQLPVPTAMALIGGAYHEAWHTKYSCRRDLKVREVWSIIEARWDKLDDWSKLSGTLAEWSNIVEDIRIERRGCEDFPGATYKMEDLQHFILDQEEDSRKQAALQGMSEEQMNKPLTIVSATFRDVGLGYNTDKQRRMVDAYRERNPEAVDFVFNGPLSDLLRESIALTRDDDLGSLRIAMDVIIAISEAKDMQDGDASDRHDQDDDQDQQDGQGQGQGQQGQGGQQACPNCGSHDVVIRPLTRGGTRIKDKGVLVCKDCEYEEEVDLNSDDSEGSKGSKGSKSAKWEDEDHERPGDGPQDGEEEDDGSTGPSSQGEGQQGSQDGSEGQDGDSDGDEEGEGQGSGDEEGEGQGSGDGEGEDGEGGGDGEGSEGGQGQGGQDGDAGGKQGSGDGPSGPGGEIGGQAGSAGGHNHNTDKPRGWDVVAQDFLDAAEQGDSTGLIDNNTAMEAAFDNEQEKEDRDCKYGEAPYRPLDRSLDSVDYVPESYRGRSDDMTRAQALLGSVKAQTSYLRARLRSLVKAVEQTAVEHGVRRGKGLSERMFVDSKCAIQSGRMPSRAYYDEEDQIDTSMAAAIVIDQSGSMNRMLQDATRIMLAITEPLDALGCATMAVGFRNGQGYGGGPVTDGKRQYHRSHGVHIDVFKAFHEKFSVVKWRFANTQATGGTPMADGIQFALEHLSERPEAHRVLFVVTDGCPNYGHAEVMQRQIRLAKEAGIQVIGVGMGDGASYVKTTFPDHVWTNTIAELPKMLVSKLNNLMDFRGTRRGRRYKQTA